jgi:hypothetical protein
VIVGRSDDPHVTAVLQQLPSSRTTLLLDAADLTEVPFALRPSGEFTLRAGGQRLDLRAGRPVPGWIRRIAPAEWQRGVVVESEEAAIKSACLSVIAALARSPAIEWLSSLDACVAAENKVRQYAAASQLGISTPQTVVTSDPDELAEFPDYVVIKPLGPGHYYADDDPMVVYATAMSRGQAAGLPLQTAPFLIQEHLVAMRHYRIVTVANDAWSSAIEADGRPVDWRSDHDAHQRFTARPVPASVTDQAIELTHRLGLGYSSQDWIETANSYFFLDLNPGGQWLFLPEQQANAITKAIAAYLGSDL